MLCGTYKFILSLLSGGNCYTNHMVNDTKGRDYEYVSEIIEVVTKTVENREDSSSINISRLNEENLVKLISIIEAYQYSVLIDSNMLYMYRMG